jgi:hypothetical protein
MLTDDAFDTSQLNMAAPPELMLMGFTSNLTISGALLEPPPMSMVIQPVKTNNKLRTTNRTRFISTPSHKIISELLSNGMIQCLRFLVKSYFGTVFACADRPTLYRSGS